MSASQAHLDLGNEEHTSSESLDLRFAEFCRENPDAIDALVEICRELKTLGETRISMKFVVEIARYKFIIRRLPGQRFAINNSFTSRFARIIETSHEDLAGMFELRVLADERGDA